MLKRSQDLQSRDEETAPGNLAGKEPDPSLRDLLSGSPLAKLNGSQRAQEPLIWSIWVSFPEQAAGMKDGKEQTSDTCAQGIS